MNIPKDLQGKEALPFIEYVKVYLQSLNSYLGDNQIPANAPITMAETLRKIKIVGDFLNKDFTPELIEYFEGADKILFDTEFLEKQKTLDQFITNYPNTLTYKED